MTVSSLAIPQAVHAHLPPGYVPAGEQRDLLPWAHVGERLSAARVYWIATTRPDGRPHVSPVWGLWLDNVIYFDGSPESRRVQNMVMNPAVSVHLESNEGRDVVIVEGEAYELKQGPGAELAARLAAAYSEKYRADQYAPPADTWDQGGLYRLQPRVVVAWTEMRNATRWRFG